MDLDDKLLETLRLALETGHLYVAKDVNQDLQRLAVANGEVMQLVLSLQIHVVEHLPPGVMAAMDTRLGEPRLGEDFRTTQPRGEL